MSDRIVIETPCEHGMTLEHAVYESVIKAINRAAGKPISPSSIDTCPGGSRRVLTEDELHKVIVQAMHAYAHSSSLESACELTDVALEKLGLPTRRCHPAEWRNFHGGADEWGHADDTS